FLITRPYGCGAISILRNDGGGVDGDAALVFHCKKRPLSFVCFGFRVKDNYQHSVHDGFAPFLISSFGLINAIQAPHVNLSKRLYLRITESRSLREFAKFVKKIPIDFSGERLQSKGLSKSRVSSATRHGYRE